jgi:hypothetical protein
MVVIPKEIEEYYNKIHDRRSDVNLAYIDEKYALIRIKNEYFDYFCGYTWFEQSKIPVSWHEYSGIPYDLDVHGGLTYSETVGDYIIYGFDCAHLRDEDNLKLRDESYILELCQIMRSEIIKGVHKWCKDTKEELTRIYGGDIDGNVFD